MRRSYARWRALPGAQRAVLCEALIGLPVTTVGLRLFGLRRFAPPAAWSSATTGPAAHPSPDLARARQLAGLVELAARHGIGRPACLARSVVLWRMLQRRGIGADLRIGVRRAPDQPAPQFHAWVEHGGEVLNDDPLVPEHFRAFSG